MMETMGIVVTEDVFRKGWESTALVTIIQIRKNSIL